MSLAEPFFFLLKDFFLLHIIGIFLVIKFFLRPILTHTKKKYFVRTYININKNIRNKCGRNIHVFVSGHTINKDQN